MSELRRAGFKQGVRGGEISDRMKHQSAEIRKGKRSEVTKRFRYSSEPISTEAFSETALLTTALAIKSLDRTAALTGVSNLRALMSCEGKDPPIQAVLNAGVMTDLIRILSCNDDILISEAIWCITNIATGNHDQTGAAIHAVPALLNILCSPVRTGLLSLQEQVCGAIGNIAGDSDEYRSALLENGVLQPLVDFLLHLISCLQGEDTGMIGQSLQGSESPDLRKKQYISSASTAAWALSNMSRGSIVAAVFLNSGVTEPLIAFLRRGDVSINPVALQTEICWLFAFLSAKEDESVVAFIDQGLIEAMIHMAAISESSSIDTVPCIRTLVNLSSGPAEWLNRVLQQGLLVFTLENLSDNSVAQRSVAKESLWLLSNLLGGGAIHRRAVLQCSSTARLLENIAKALLSDQFELQRESLFALQYACLDKDEFIYSVFGGSRVIGQIIQLLKAPDMKVNMTCLQLLRVLTVKPKVLAICADLGLHDILDEIQYGPGDQEMRQVARVLAEDLFEVEDEEEIHIDSNISSSGGQSVFTFGLEGGVNLGDAVRGGMGRGSHLNRPAWMGSN